MANACRLDANAPITVQALGDFPATGNTVERIDPADGAMAIERFPIDTRLLRLSTGEPEVNAAGVVALSPLVTERAVLLLPLSRSCASPDFEARARSGAAVVALPDGSLLIAGGRDDEFGGDAGGAAVSSAVVLPAASELVAQVARGMFLRRAGASATVFGEEVLVIGGGAHDRGPAHDTFERFAVATSSFRADAGDVLVHGPRRDHGAVALRDGSAVVIAGGVNELGQAPLRSVERITDAGASDLGALAEARTQPQLHALADGRVLVVGGRDALDRVVTSVEVIDSAGEISSAALALDAASNAVSTPLVGERVAWVGCDGGACRVSLLLTSPRLQRVDLGATLPALARLQAIGLTDGRLLVVGQRRLSDLAQAWIVDPETDRAVEVDATRVPSALVMLSDGVVAELDTSGVSQRRVTTHTAFDNPASTLLADDPLLVLDHVDHWRSEAGAMVAQVDARIDVALLQLADFRLSLEVSVPSEGALTWVLQTQASAVPITIGAMQVSLGDCTINVGEGEITIERSGGRVRVHGADATCEARLDGQVSLHAIASADVRIGPLRLQRL